MSVYCIEPEKCTRNLLIPPKDVCKNEKRGCVVHVDTPSSFWGYWPSQANEPLFLFFTVKERRGTPRLYHLFVSRQLLNDCFDSFVTFNGYNNYTLRSSDCCVVRSQNCVSNYLT